MKFTLRSEQSLLVMVGMLLCGLIVTIGFQNCSEGFKISSDGQKNLTLIKPIALVDVHAIEALNLVGVSSAGSIRTLQLTKNSQIVVTKDDIGLLSQRRIASTAQVLCDQGSQYNSATSICEPIPNFPIINYLVANPSIIPRGYATHIQYAASNFERIVVYDGTQEVFSRPSYSTTGESGYFGLTPQKTTTYEVMVIGAGQVSKKSLTIEVRELADPLFIKSSTPFTAQLIPLNLGNDGSFFTYDLKWGPQDPKITSSVLTKKTAVSSELVGNFYSQFSSTHRIHTILPATYSILALTGSPSKPTVAEVASVNITPAEPALQPSSGAPADCEGVYRVTEGNLTVFRYLNSGVGNSNFDGSVAPDKVSCSNFFAEQLSICSALNPTCHVTGFLSQRDPTVGNAVVAYRVFPQSQTQTNVVGVCNSSFYTNKTSVPELSGGDEFIVSGSSAELIQDCNALTALSFLAISRFSASDLLPVKVKSQYLVALPSNQAIFNFQSTAAPIPVPADQTSCDFGGQTVPSGQSIKAYQTSTVAFGSTCNFESRLCTNGVLSGNYSFGACSVNPDPAIVRNKIITLYKNILDRTDAEIAADQAGIANWVNAVNAGTTLTAVEQALRSSDEYYVRQLYKTELYRNGDAAGILFWVNEISSGRRTRAAVRTEFQRVCAEHEGGACPGTAPAPTPPVSCQDSGGAVINGFCHFGNSCLTQEEVAAKFLAVKNTYTSCATAVAVNHADCVNGYGSTRGLVAKCPLLNAAEIQIHRVTTLEQRIEDAYRVLRLRNPDLDGYNWWYNAIYIDRTKTEQNLHNTLQSAP